MILEISNPIKQHADWLIRIRWVIASFSILVITIAYLLQISDICYFGLYASSSVLLGLNVLYKLSLKRIIIREKGNIDKYINNNVRLQIFFDFLILTVMLHFSGSIENPCIIFYVFHMIIASIILPQKQAYQQALIAIVLFSLLIGFEYFKLLPHYSLNNQISLINTNNILYLVLSLMVFMATSLMLVYFTTTISEKLRIAQISLKEKNDILINQDKIKNEFVSRVTHNIKGDLSTISSCLSVVSKQIVEPASAEGIDMVNKAYIRTNKVIEFVDDLLHLIKMRLDRCLDTAEFDICNSVNNSIEKIKHIADEKQINLIQNIPSNPHYIIGVKTSIEEVIYNIVHNAVKYTPIGGSVVVSVVKTTGKVKICIEDTGYGISKNDIPHIFKEFYRADNILDCEGSGLGLSLAKAVIDRHRGKITVQSELNKGTKFTISLFMKFNSKTIE